MHFLKIVAILILLAENSAIKRLPPEDNLKESR